MAGPAEQPAERSRRLVCSQLAPHFPPSEHGGRLNHEVVWYIPSRAPGINAAKRSPLRVLATISTPAEASTTTDGSG